MKLGRAAIKLTKYAFLVLLALLAILFVFGIAYALSIWMQVVPPEAMANGYACGKLGLRCDVAPMAVPSSYDKFLASLIGETWSDHLASSALFLFVGCLAYKFRCKAQALYGMLEVIAAVAFSATFLYSINVQNFRLFSATVGLLAAVYVVVRGLDNIDKGLASGLPEYHSWWKWFWVDN